MKPQEIEKLRMLDVNGINGTIQSTLLNPNINQTSYPEVLYYLLSKTLEEKNYLERCNNKMTNVMVANKMFDELNKCLELEEKL